MPVEESTLETAPTPEVVEEVPEVTHESYGWDDWDGESYDQFPEGARGWVETLHGRMKGDLTLARDAQKTAEDEATYRTSLYESAIQGFEDPRIATLTEELEKLKGEHSTLTEEYGSHKGHFDSYMEESGEQYLSWFKEVYGERMAADPELANRTLDLAELDFATGDDVLEMHQAIILAELGQEAVDYLKEWAPKVSKEVALEIVLARYDRPEPEPAAAPQRPQAPPSASLVRGAKPVATPLPKPKSPVQDIAKLDTRSAIRLALQRADDRMAKGES